MTQGELFPDDGAGTIQERFERFHRLNPWVCEALERLAAEMVARGRKRVGIKMLFEVLRWEYARRTNDPTSEFKLNNVFTSRYVRLLIERHPSWADVFETRVLKAK